MNYLTLNSISKSFNGIPLFSDLNLSLNEGDKVAIVGRNGAGKSTLAKIIVGEEPADSGQIFKVSNVKIGYFSQHSFLNSEKRVYEAMLEVFNELYELELQLNKLNEQFQQTLDGDILDRYNQLLLIFEDKGGYTYRYRIESMLNRFGFKTYYEHPVQRLSGGERTRLALAKLLLEEPDVLILDEPTNHLDIETIEFLENFLKAYKKSVILISHDRYFLNQIVNLVYEIELRKGSLYKGDYDDYLVEKEERYEKMLKDYEAQQKLIQKEQEFIDKNLTRASTTKRAQARRKKLEKLEVMDLPKIDERKMNLTFKLEKTSGNVVLTAEQLAIGYTDTLLSRINFEIRKGEKVAIIGSNGVGKSTLLKTVQGMVEPKEGRVKFGAGIIKAYFDQDNVKVNSDKTVLDEIWDENRMMLEKDVRNLLARFLFTGEDVFKNVNELSGGEKVRLTLVKLYLEKANLLILDEVTNHLDIQSKEVLEDSLIDYEGTILFVSHDRYFINRVATKIFEIGENKWITYDGDYDYYIYKKKQFEEEARKREEELQKGNSYEQNKQQRNYIKKLERELELIEAELEQMDQEMEELKALQLKEDVYLNPQKALEVHDATVALEEHQQEKLERWTALSEELESLTNQ